MRTITIFKNSNAKALCLKKDIKIIFVKMVRVQQTTVIGLPDLKIVEELRHVINVRKEAVFLELTNAELVWITPPILIALVAQTHFHALAGIPIVAIILVLLHVAN